MRKIYDPGTGHAAQIAELDATRKRLRDDRKAGLYDSADDAEWYRTEYRRIGEEITALKALPERKPGMRMMPTGRSIAQEWETADELEELLRCCRVLSGKRPGKEAKGRGSRKSTA